MNVGDTEGRLTPVDRRTWVFQARLDKYRIGDSLRIEDQELWNLNQHADSVCVGDRVIVWIAGSDAGIYAVGTVITAPVPRADSNRGQQYWISDDGQKVKPRVLVRYERKFLDRPLRKAYLKTDPRLSSLRVMIAPRGTVFRVDDEQWQALEEWLEDA